jgi:acetamidase/formamidase
MGTTKQGYVGHFPTRNEKLHAERRRIVNHVYSMSSVLESEEAIDSCTQLLCDTFSDFASQKTVIGMSLWMNMYVTQLVSFSSAVRSGSTKTM